jgi:hypothetical protein
VTCVLTKRRWFRTLAYLFAVAVHAVLVVNGWSFLIEARYVEFRLLYFLGIACLVPVLCGWAAISVHLIVKQARTRVPLPKRTRRLILIAILVALAALGCYRGYRGILYAVTDGVAQKRFSLARDTVLPLVERNVRSFYRIFGRVPSDLPELEAESFGTNEGVPSVYYMDPCSDLSGRSRTPLHYVQLDDTTVLIYSVGPDCDDDKGEKEFTEDLFRYHWSYRPWRCMPFGMLLYKASGLSQKFDGDITRTVSF